MEESQAKLKAKLEELEKSSVGGAEEAKDAPMEEAPAVDTPAAAPETAPEPEPTKDAEEAAPLPATAEAPAENKGNLPLDIVTPTD